MIPGYLSAQSLKENPDLDAKVKVFLSSQSRQWYDMNVPASDGQLLHDIIIKGNYKSVLEIGTSTGHSGIWIAWALSKTGGCFASHNVYDRSAGGAGGRGGGSGQDVYLEYVKSLKNYETTVNSTGGGLAISYKKSEK